MTDEPAADPHETCGRKLEDIASRLDDFVGVLQQHARILEKHATAIADIGKTMKSVDAGVKIVVDAQKAQNQLTANLHQMYSRLRCMMPDPPDDDGEDDCPTRDRRPSEEVRQLRLLGQNGIGEE